MPEHWVIGKVKYVTENLDKKRIPLSAEERGHQQGEYPFNADLRLTITAISVPRSFLARGYQSDEPDGAGSSIDFADEVLIDLYQASGRPQIFSASWVPIIGGRGVEGEIREFQENNYPK